MSARRKDVQFRLADAKGAGSPRSPATPAKGSAIKEGYLQVRLRGLGFLVFFSLAPSCSSPVARRPCPQPARSAGAGRVQAIGLGPAPPRARPPVGLAALFVCFCAGTESARTLELHLPPLPLTPPRHASAAARQERAEDVVEAMVRAGRGGREPEGVRDAQGRGKDPVEQLQLALVADKDLEIEDVFDMGVLLGRGTAGAVHKARMLCLGEDADCCAVKSISKESFRYIHKDPCCC